jgi:hypothetical protein
LDGDHVDHPRARQWLTDNAAAGWASCAITQAGFIRIVCQPRYPGAWSPSEAGGRLRAATSHTSHAYWACDVEPVHPDHLDLTRIHGPSQITDSYLLALAVAHAGRFVTFDQGIALSAVPQAEPHHLVTL